MTDQSLFRRDHCSALVITCSDFRFKSAERAFAAGAFPDDYDLIARPGSIRALVAPRTPAARDTMQAEIDLLWSVHHFDRVVILNHMSCRAYDDLATEKNEIAIHTDHLKKACEIIEQRVAGVRAEPYIVQITGGELQALLVDRAS